MTNPFVESNIGLMVGMICHVFPGNRPSEYMGIPTGPRAMNFDGALATQVLKALNPNPDESRKDDQDIAKRRVSMSRSKIDRRSPHVKKAIERRGLKL